MMYLNQGFLSLFIVELSGWVAHNTWQKGKTLRLLAQLLSAGALGGLGTG